MADQADVDRVKAGDHNLRGADLRGADLRGAHLRGAHLRGAHLRGAHLRVAKYDDYTQWPANFDPVAAGAVKWQ